MIALGIATFTIGMIIGMAITAVLSKSSDTKPTGYEFDEHEGLGL